MIIEQFRPINPEDRVQARLDAVPRSSPLHEATVGSRAASAVLSAHQHEQTELPSDALAVAATRGVISLAGSQGRTGEEARVFLRDCHADYPRNFYSSADAFYATGLSADVAPLDTFADRSIESLEVEEHTDAVFTHSDWMQPVPPVNPFKVAEFMKNSSNLESVPIRASWHLGKLKYGDFHDERDLLRTVRRATSFDAVLTQALGYDVLSSGLYDVALRKSLIAVGQGARLERAEERMAPIGKEMIQEIVTRVTQGYEVAPEVVDIVADDTPGYRRMYDVRMDDTKGGRARAKSPSSLARKELIDELNGDDPEAIMDPVGITILSNNTTELAQQLKTTLVAIAGDEGITPRASVNRDTPFSVQGTQRYIDEIYGSFQSTGHNNVHPKLVDELGFHVAKVTANIFVNGEPVNFEIMFMTNEDYDRSRYGECAHFVYEYFKGAEGEIDPREMEEVVEGIKDMRSRLPNLGKKELNRQAVVSNIPPYEERLRSDDSLASA